MTKKKRRRPCGCLPNVRGFAVHLLVLDLLAGFGVAPQHDTGTDPVRNISPYLHVLMLRIYGLVKNQ